MGLLDDAIREHLELKRLRGADPSEVTRQEREALESSDGRDRAPSAEDATSSEASAGQRGGSPVDGSQHRDEPELVHTSEETAELDMRTVLAGESPAVDSIRQVDESGPETPDASTGEHAESSGDSLEWETPATEEGIPRERDEADREGIDRDAEPVEDVLEETPDFLRETPDQERLWFEQRPPRDFDFDK